MVEAVDLGQDDEGLVIRAGHIVAALVLRVGGVIKWIVSDQICREDEWELRRPSHHCCSRWLCEVLEVVCEILIRKVLVPILVVGISPALDHLPVILLGNLKPLGVHGGEDLDPSAVHQPRHPLISPVIPAKELDKNQENLPAYRLVAVHVPHVLELRLPGLVLAGIVGDLYGCEVPTLDRLTGLWCTPGRCSGSW